MSTKEMEAMDNEVMGVVNGHAAPEAVTAAEEIAEKATAPQGKPDAAPENERTDDYVYRLRKKEFEELSAKVETERRRKTMTTVILCVLLAAALLAVLAMPKLLTWLVNLGMGTCAVVAGITLDRRWRR